jgi:outer membrane protein insertion porin family
LGLGGALLRTLGALALICAAVPVFGWQAALPAQEHPSPVTQPVGTIASYQGLVIQDIRFPQVTGSDGRYRDTLALKAGDSLTRDGVRESIQKLHDTGRFADISVEADKTADGHVLLSFVTVPNYFIGDVRVEGTPIRPNENQIVNISKLQLGELFTGEKLDRALASINQLLQENGYHRATVQVEKDPHPENQQINLTFVIVPGPQARVGHVIVTGKARFSQGQIQDIAKLHPGDTVTVQRVSNALDRIRKKYQKQDRLLAQVAIRSRVYHPENNTVDFTIDVDPGPKVLVGVSGFKMSQGAIRRNVPVYEENAFDDDLLNEGRRNLLNFLEGKGYFDAKIGIKKHSEASDVLQVVYVVDPGRRHKLAKILLSGNKYFPDDLIVGRMQVAAAERFFSQGRYNQRLLADDVRGIEDLYRANGFQQVKVSGTTIDNYEGDERQLAVKIEVQEGPQRVVGALHIVGNEVIPESQFPTLNTAEGQPFSETNIATDRDILLNFYFNHGFPNASFDASALPSAEANRMEVTYTVHEGEEFFVNRVLVSGLEHTRQYIVDRELRVQPGDPLSQLDMLRTQQRLYDLGIFGQVDTAVQNPQGAEKQKNALVDVTEAKRYTFNYGLGLEFQTGQPAGSNQPQGATGVSPACHLI